MSLIISFLCSAAWSRIFVADRDESPRSMSSMGTTPSVIAGPKSSRSLSGGNCIKSLRSNRTTSCRSCVDPNVLVCATCFRNTSQLEVTSTPNMHQELSLTISMLVNVRKLCKLQICKTKICFHEAKKEAYRQGMLAYQPPHCYSGSTPQSPERPHEKIPR